MKKKYGVWGLGVVGKSVLSYLHKQGHELSVMDKRTPSHEEQTFLKKINAQYIPQSDGETFFSLQDVIVPSPGIDIASARAYQHKMVEELDLFADAWKKPLIAITGTLGKTSVTHLLSRILAANGVRVATGGNIGTGMLDLLDEQSNAGYGLLELSSFQLERSTRFVPDVAIWTNLYPNHLDRHGTIENYFQAKFRILMNQSPDQKALIPLEFALTAYMAPHVHKLQRPMHYFSTNLELVSAAKNALSTEDILYYLQDSKVIKLHKGNTQEIYNLSQLQAQDIPHENLLMLLATSDLLNLLHKSTFIIPPFELPAHRFEHVGASRNITFYNDSKSSILEATFAAVERLQPARIELFLGGVSKGVDRTASIGHLKNKVASVVCFGGEADILFEACKKAGIEAFKYETLDDAFKNTTQRANKASTILFSPAGASFDLFKNYQERGNRFKELVQEFLEQESLESEEGSEQITYREPSSKNN